MIGTKVDAYTLKARWAPAAFASVPILVIALSSVEVAKAVGLLGPAAAALVFGLLASEVARSRGRAVQVKLTQKWGGLPTTRALRATQEPRSDQGTRRRDQVEHLTGRSLPGWSEQASDGFESDQTIERAVRGALARLRHAEAPGAALLQSENVSYGFRRNLYALRALGLTAALVSIVATALAASFGLITWGISVPILTIQAAVAGVWLFVATDKWVKDQAEVFAEQFFVVLDANGYVTST